MTYIFYNVSFHTMPPIVLNNLVHGGVDAAMATHSTGVELPQDVFHFSWTDDNFESKRVADFRYINWPGKQIHELQYIVCHIANDNMKSNNSMYIYTYHSHPKNVSWLDT